MKNRQRVTVDEKEAVRIKNPMQRLTNRNQ